MRELEESMAAIDRARDGVDGTDVRTQLDSIRASLEEMIDTAAGNLTDSDDALGGTEFEGAAPSADNLEELEGNLRELAEEVDHRDVREHLETARRLIVDYRTSSRE